MVSSSRADLHTLFDLDLMGVEPVSLAVRFHPEVIKQGYEAFEGRTLSVQRDRPDSKALPSRWESFCVRQRRGD